MKALTGTSRAQAAPSRYTRTGKWRQVRHGWTIVAVSHRRISGGLQGAIRIQWPAWLTEQAGLAELREGAEGHLAVSGGS